MFHDASMKLLEPPTLWMISVTQRGRSRRPNTWKSYAADLLDYLHFCEANELNYMDPARGMLAAYRDQMQTRLTKRHGVEAPLASNTINHRLGVVASFYSWLFQEGLVSCLPFRREERRLAPRDVDAFAHNRRTLKSGSDASVPAGPQKVPKVVDVRVIRLMQNTLRERDADIMSLGLSTGARIDEMLALNIDQIPNDQNHLSARSVAVYLTETKGLWPRNIYIPLPILTDINRYIFGERARIVRRLRARREPWDRKALFLSEKGLRLSYKTYWNAFHDAAGKAKSSATIHGLRHTFAIYTLARLRAVSTVDKRGRAADPLFQLQELLGHRSISSTQIYVRALDENPHAAEDAMSDFVALWRGRA